MKRTGKILICLLITIIVIFGILITGTILFQDKISGIFLNGINRNINATIDVGKVRFSLIRDFPRASVEFRDIKIVSHLPCRPEEGQDEADDPLVDAEQLSVSFNVRDIINKRYSVDKITVKRGYLSIRIDTCGNSNLKIWSDRRVDTLTVISVNLQNLRIEETRVLFTDERDKIIIDCFSGSATGRVSADGNRTEIEATVDFDINNISFKGGRILSEIPDVMFSGGLVISPDSIRFNDCSLNILRQEAEVAGTIFKKRGSLEFDINTVNPDIKAIKGHFPQLSKIPAGLEIKRIDSHISFNFKTLKESFYININPFSISYPGSEGEGSLIIRNLNNPYVDLIFNGSLDPEGVLKIVNTEHIESVKGTVQANVRLFGRLPGLKDLTFKKIVSLERYLNLHLNSVDLTLDSFSYPLNNICGNIMIAENAWMDALSFNFAGQNIILNGKVDNPENLIKGSRGNVSVTAGLWADRFNSNTLLILPPGREKKPGNKPDDISRRFSARLDITVDSLIVKQFASSQFQGTMSYRDGFFNLHSFNILALDGALSGNAAIIKNSAGGYHAKGWFDITAIDVNKTFETFNNFGQQIIVADNIKGNLTGSVSISYETDSLLKPLMPSLSVTGNYSVMNGELIGFEPMRKLSRFIEVSELENIRFEELSNDLLITDSRLLIPSMKIKSSAFNISLSGEQSFKGNFEYHLTVLLSELLSRKARKSGSYISEFGPVEDDGLGRTSLFLKLEKGDDGTKVSYDVKQLSEEIKSDLLVEKQVLKTILNEEYGWYGKDTLNAAAKESSKRFKITWEEADSIQVINPPGKTGLPGLLKKLKKSDTTGRQVNDTIIKKF